ncbi:MAG: M28 family peptidase [Bacteroidales bacterium]|nr:M28 family peptidase [Bacteroidales bacterium]
MHHILSIMAAVAMATSCGSGNASSASAETSGEASAPVAAVDFNADSAFAFVKAQCDFGPRVPETPAHKQCGEWIEAQLRRWCHKVVAQQAPLTTFDGKTLNATNYIGIINPSAKERILLLAHWDCRPWADADPDETKRGEAVMGANDGASGVGVLLELARLMHGKNPNVGVDILFTDAEDWGTDGDEESWALGTQYWVQHPHVANYKPLYGILLDMVGAADAQFYHEGFSLQNAPDVVERLWTIAGDSGYSNHFKSLQFGAATDDHVFVIRGGIPCIDIIDMRPGTTSGFYPHWHTTADTIDKIAPATLKAVGQTLANLIYEL